MKKTLIMTAAVAAFSASTLFAATPSACETYAKAPESGIREIKSVDPTTTTLTTEELGMVQTAILMGNPAEPMTADQALDVFMDKDGSGSNSGSLSYGELTVGLRTVTVVRATYFPGDNEYGALFTVRPMSGNHGVLVDLIGQIQDGDVVCLSYVQ